MLEDFFLYALPKGFRHGASLIFDAMGHEGIDKRRGDLIAQFWYIMPHGWTLDDKTGDISYSVTITLEQMFGGYRDVLITPDNQLVEINIKAGFDILKLVEGITIEKPGWGTIVSEAGDRADLYVHIDAASGDGSVLDQLTERQLKQLLQTTGFKASDPYFGRLLQMCKGSVGAVRTEDVTVGKGPAD